MFPHVHCLVYVLTHSHIYKPKYLSFIYTGRQTIEYLVIIIQINVPEIVKCIKYTTKKN